MLLESLLEEEKLAFKIVDDSKKNQIKEEVEVFKPKDEPNDGLTEEERKALDKGNDFLLDCGCPILEKKDSQDALLESESLALPSKPQEFFLAFQSITDRRYIEAFPNGLLGEIYTQARTRLPYRVFRF